MTREIAAEIPQINALEYLRMGTRNREQVEQALAERMRSERVRLGLSSARVADICGVTETTVLNWEKRRARIPLAAAALLWEHGFDTEGLLEGEAEFVRVPEHPQITAAGFCMVSKHLLRRSLVGDGEGYVYYSRRPDEGLEKLGAACVVQPLADITDVLLDARGLCLFGTREKGEYFICNVESKSGEQMSFSAGGYSVTMQAARFRKCCRVLGRCAYWLPGITPVGRKKESNADVLRRAAGALQSL